ncbi:MAG: N-acetylglucosamine-6-phosphate deacetylase [bacterium]|nr:N-acetylglucosamine-6-phosphate deacetylase [bacterium]
MNLLILNARLITPERILTGYSLLIEKTKIKKIMPPGRSGGLKKKGYILLDVRGDYVAPGLIDIHIQGYKGHDVWEKRPYSPRDMSRKLLLSGTTSYLATTHYDEGVINNIIRSLPGQSREESEILGLHLEGPFINPRRLGMIPGRSIRKFSREFFYEHIAPVSKRIKLMTIAPELEGAAALIRELKRSGTFISMGHSRAGYQEAIDGFNLGISQVTHIFNAMEPLHHREPNAITAALLDPRIYVQVIADGIHLHPAVLNMILKLKGPDRIILITDAVKAAGFKKGVFFNDGLKVKLEHGAVRGPDGSLAGSSLTLLEAVKNMMKFTSVSLKDAFKMATFVPASSIRIQKKKGEISPGKDADLIILDHNLKLKKVVKSGEVFNVKKN